MLELLNSVLHAPIAPTADRVLWYDLKQTAPLRLSELRGEVAALRHKLAQYQRERWLLYSENPRSFLVGLLALLVLGKQVVICANKKPEWLTLLAGKFDAVLSDEGLVATVDGADESARLVVDFGHSAGSDGDWHGTLSGDEALVFYTSGSTGQPKAVYKTLRALTNEIDTLGRVFASAVQGRVFIASVSHLHIYGLLFRVLLPLAVDGSGVIQQIEFPEQLQWSRDQLRAAGADDAAPVFISSPAFLSRLDTGLPSVAMAAVFSSGGPLSFNAAQQATACLASTPVEVYGSTETGGIGYRQQRTESPPWQLFPGMLLSGSATGTGLLSPHMPGLPVYELDDNLDILADGRFILKGRKDRIVKIAEKRVSLTEIENFLQGQPGIAQCVALPLLLKREMVVCAVVLTPAGNSLLATQGERALIASWKEAMRGRFDNVTIPRKWQILAEIPLNSQSKIDSTRLLAGFTGSAN